MNTQADFFRTIERFGDNVAVVDRGRATSYRELAAEADRWAQRIGREPSLVFLECGNDVASIAAYLGCLRGNHVVHLFADMDEDRLGDLVARYRPSVVLRQVGDELIAQPQDEALVSLHPDLRILLSTSGSTGSPKFVKLSERNVAANAASICAYLGLTAEDRALTSLKFNYSYGMSVVNTHLAVGGALVLTKDSVTSPEFWRLFETAGATSFAGVPYTFETLAGSDGWAAQPKLRYVTQAGGRLAPELVRHFARLGAQRGWDFVVMYGQTEAAPRMAWLPPQLAEDHPDCIGIAVPGGAFALLDDHGDEIEEADRAGELVFAGPNVMMGYAQCPADLVTDETPDRLRTGDIALRTGAGLYRIVGRAARIVKPFGIRLNLDEVQTQVRERLPEAVCAGTDERIVIAVPRGRCEQPQQWAAGIASHYRLPRFMVTVVPFVTMPTLPNGKPDLQAILAAGSPPEAANSEPNLKPPFALSLGSLQDILFRGATIVRSPLFYRRTLVEAKVILGLDKPDWQDVAAIFAALTSAEVVTGSDSFQSLAGDSLSYVQASLALEGYLGFLPDGWETYTISELEDLRRDVVIV